MKPLGRAVKSGVLPAVMLVATLFGCDRNQPPTPTVTTTQQSAAATPPQAKVRWPFTTADTVSAPSGFDPAAAIKRNYYVVFDASGSMKDSKCSGQESKIAVGKRVLREFAAKLPADVNLGLLVFDGKGIRELIALSPIQLGASAQAIASISAGGATPLADSIRQAYAALTEQGRRQFGYGEFHLVVVTDGEATGESPRDVVNSVLANSPVVLHTIGFCIGNDHSLNQPGRVVYRAADNPAALAQGLADVLAESPTFDVRSFK